MQIRDLMSMARSRLASPNTEALDRHARLLVNGDLAGAAAVREQQDPATADLMLLAEDLAAALRPLPLSEETRAWLWQLVLSGKPESRRRRLATAVRHHGREAAVGAALIGTAVSIGAVAWHYHGRHSQGNLLGSSPS